MRDNRRPVHAESLLELTFVSDPRVSRDGRIAAAVHTTIEAGDSNRAPRYTTELKLYSVADGRELNAERLVRARAPRFSNAGRLAFLAVPGTGSAETLALMNIETDEITIAQAGDGRVLEFAWHPNGQGLAMIRLDAGEPSSSWTNETARWVDRLRYRADEPNGYAPDRAQLWWYDVESESASLLGDLPHAPNGMTFSHDGTRLYFFGAANVEEDDWRLRGIYQYDLNAREVSLAVRPRPLASAMSVSPDDRRIAFLAPIDNRSIANPTGLWVVDLQGGEPQYVGGKHVAAPVVRGDSRHGSYPNAPDWLDNENILCNTTVGGRSGLAAVNLPSREYRYLQTEPRAVTAFSRSEAAVAFTAESPAYPGELFVRDQQGVEKRLSHANEEFVRSYRLFAPVGPFTVEGAGGRPLEYWMTTPAQARDDQAVVFEVHAGAQTVFGYGFILEVQLLVARGYSVLFSNPHGSGTPLESPDVGPALAESRLRRYTEQYPNDCVSVVDAALAKHTRPEAPVHVTGGSNGGYMTNWLVSNTNKFRSAVADRSLSDLVSAHGLMDTGFQYIELEHGGSPWTNAEDLWRQSPLRYADQVITPILIMHGEQDRRCPIAQAEEWFAALKRIGKTEVRFLRFPGEGHELPYSGRPDRRIARLRAIVDWFESHP